MASHERVLITGGAGFIGARLAKKLADGHEVLSFDNLHPLVHGLLPRSCEVSNVQGDIADFGAVADVVTYFSPTVVYHLAAETGTGQSWDEPGRHCDVNVKGTANLIEAIRKSGKNVRRVVVAGSRSVYGEGAYRDGSHIVCGEPRTYADMAKGDFTVKSASSEVLEPVPTPEDLPVRPASVYASTKLMQEYLFSQCFEGTGIEINRLRFQNVYGAGQSLRNPYTGVISIFCQQALEGKRLNIFEDGSIVRDFVHVSDVAEALAALVRDDIVCGPAIINIGSGKPVTILEVAQELLKNLNRDPDDLAITGDFRRGDIRHAVAETARAKSLLHWSARLPIAEGLKEIAEWARSGGLRASDARTESGRDSHL